MIDSTPCHSLSGREDASNGRFARTARKYGLERHPPAGKVLELHPGIPVSLLRPVCCRNREEAVLLTYSRIITAAGVIAALAIATPAAGQGRARGRYQAAQQQTNNRSEGRARGREESRPPAPAARPSLPPQASSSP